MNETGDELIERIAVARSLIEHPWRFAKTFVNLPHYYTLRRQWRDDAEFVRVIEFMKQYGLDEVWHDRPFRILLINEFKYWFMMEPTIDQTDLINRKPHELDPHDPNIFWIGY